MPSLAPATATTITLVRHGQSVSNAGGVTMPHATIPLTELGHRQASAVVAHLPARPAQLRVSPFTRAQDTARPYSQHTGVPITTDPALHEFETFDSALLQGMTGAQRAPVVDAYWAAANPHRRMGEHAETFAEFDQRVQHFYQHTLPMLPDATVVFGHGMWMACLLWKVLGMTGCDSAAMAAFRRFQLGFPMPNTCVHQLIGTPDGAWRWHIHAAALRAQSAVV